MKIRFLSIAVCAGVTLMCSGCLRLATAPMRAEAREKGEDAMARLAAIEPATIATFVTQRMSEALGLSSDVQTRIAAINLSYATRSRDVAASSDRLRFQLSALRKLDGERDEELKRLLTPDQFKTYREQREKMREQIKARFGSASAP